MVAVVVVVAAPASSTTFPFGFGCCCNVNGVGVDCDCGTTGDGCVRIGEAKFNDDAAAAVVVGTAVDALGCDVVAAVAATTEEDGRGVAMAGDVVSNEFLSCFNLAL